MKTNLLWKTIGGAALFVCSVVTANAAIISYGPAYSFVDGGNINLSLAVSSNTTTLTGMSITFQGDFGQAGEFMDVIIEGTSIGTLAPGLTSTGAWSTPIQLFGSNFNLDPMSSSAVLNLDIAAAVADGFLDIVFDASSAVAAFDPSTQVGQGVFTGTNGFSIAVAGNITTAVPEPSIIALFGLGLLGLGFAHRKVRS